MSSITEAKLKQKPSKKKRKSPMAFFGELKTELKKVSWPKKAELLSATKVVVVAVALFGLGIYVADFFIKGGLTVIKTVSQWVFG